MKLEIARLPERYHKTAWSLVKRVYFQSLGNCQLVNPIFNNLIKVAMENATFWENMQILEQSAGTIEGNYNSFVSAASKFNKNFTYQYPGQSHGENHAEIPEGIPRQCPFGGQNEHSTAQNFIIVQGIQRQDQELIITLITGIQDQSLIITLIPGT